MGRIQNLVRHYIVACMLKSKKKPVSCCTQLNHGKLHSLLEYVCWIDLSLLGRTQNSVDYGFSRSAPTTRNVWNLQKVELIRKVLHRITRSIGLARS
jgi:hypothetical protein